MNDFETHCMVNRTRHNEREAGLSRKAQIAEARSARQPSRMAIWAGHWLSRAGARLQGLPQEHRGAVVIASEPRSATA